MKRWLRLSALVVLLAGAALRVVGLDWDRGHLFHPDERNIVEAVQSLRRSGLRDPGFYAYNGLPLGLVLGVGELAARVSGDPARAAAPAFTARVARSLSALASIATVGVAWLLGRTLAGEAFALLLASLFAFDVGLVQAAHFGTTESLLVLLLVSLALAAARLVRSPERWQRAAVVSGLLLGLAVGTKTSGAAYAVLPGLALLLVAPTLGLRCLLAAGAGIGALAVVTACVVSPWSVLHAARFLAVMRAEHDVVMGTPIVFYTLSFLGSPAWLDLDSLHWLSGPVVPALGLAGVVGLALQSLARGVERPFLPALPLLGFSLVYAATVAGWHAKFVRYLLPLLPALLLGAAWLIRELGARRRGLGVAAGLLAVGSSVLWSVAFASIYLRPSTRLVASAWLEAHARPGSIVLGERRDYPLPVAGGDGAPRLRVGWLDGFGRDTPAKLGATSAALADADYLVLASRRVHAVVRAHPGLYPLTAALYRRLFAGELGYELAARFESQPSLLGFTIPTDGAEETFRVFDHPTVWIFRNVRRRSARQIQERVLEDVGAPGPVPARYRYDDPPG